MRDRGISMAVLIKGGGRGGSSRVNHTTGSHNWLEDDNGQVLELQIRCSQSAAPIVSTLSTLPNLPVRVRSTRGESNSPEATFFDNHTLEYYAQSSNLRPVRSHSFCWSYSLLFFVSICFLASYPSLWDGIIQKKKAGLGTVFFCVLNTSFFCVLLKNVQRIREY